MEATETGDAEEQEPGFVDLALCQTESGQQLLETLAALCPLSLCPQLWEGVQGGPGCEQRTGDGRGVMNLSRQRTDYKPFLIGNGGKTPAWHSGDQTAEEKEAERSLWNLRGRKSRECDRQKPGSSETAAMTSQEFHLRRDVN